MSVVTALPLSAKITSVRAYWSLLFSHRDLSRSHSEELFYQLGLRQFGNFHRLELEPPPSVKTLIRLAVRAEDGRWKEFGVDLDEDTVVEVSKLAYYYYDRSFVSYAETSLIVAHHQDAFVSGRYA